MGVLRSLLVVVANLVKLLLVAYFCLWAYRIRLFAINTYGFIIHEFDPWFNFRAAQYLAQNGWHNFSTWYDHMTWYPIGRPVGTTIYPGMQIASVSIWRALEHMPERKVQLPFLYVLPKGLSAYLPGEGVLHFGPMSLNDVCCMTPAWFGALATLFLALLTSECSRSSGAGVAAAFVMAIIPAHLTRSVAGGYDNESVAIAAFTCTFWLWCRSIRTPNSWLFGVLAGLAYTCAAVTWGGYVFVNNMIGVHAVLLVATGKYHDGIYRAYSLWYIVGTIGATRVPVIGWAPLRSMEQMGSLLVFCAFQLLELCDIYRCRLKGGMPASRFFFFRCMMFVFAAFIACCMAVALGAMGYFTPWSSRVRALFLEHQHTGNPLVDSVAEHMASTHEAYREYLHDARFVAALGLVFCFHQRTPAKLFPVVYAAVAYHFTLKMSRLLTICGPIVAMLAGYPVGIVCDWCFEQLLALVSWEQACSSIRADEDSVPPRTGGMGSGIRFVRRWVLDPILLPREIRDISALGERLEARLPMASRLLRVSVAAGILCAARLRWAGDVAAFTRYCEDQAPGLSEPTLVWESDDGKSIIDDYLQGYRWMGKHTPQDARIMAWWDYGYQITGIANRTTIADGNTWNHEHIATLGLIMTYPEKQAWDVMRHLADYVMVWAGEDEDLGKSQHLARIGNSVFPELMCGEDDPACDAFGFDYNEREEIVPTPMMAESFLYKACKHDDGAELSPRYFKEVHTTEHGLMRIFKVLNISEESKAWVASPANRICDAPGSWYCIGQYPPALQPLIGQRKNFAQLEDFNKRGQEKSAYTRLVESGRADF